MPRGARRRASTDNRIGMAVIAGIVTILIVVMLVQSHTLKNKIVLYQTQNAQLAQSIDEETGRKEELEKLPSYIASDAFVEKTAREKFGLVYADEIIFKAE